MRLQRLEHSSSLHVEMRSVPDRLSILEHNDLRCLVANAGYIGELARNVSCALDLQQVDLSFEFLHFAIRGGTDAAGVTVFEDNDWFGFRVSD